MEGFQISFFTVQGRRYQHMSLAEWLIYTARELGIRGSTIISASEGYGHDKSIHSAHFFELADQPQVVIMVANEIEMQQLFDLLAKEKINIFYVKTPVEFGVTGED